LVYCVARSLLSVVRAPHTPRAQVRIDASIPEQNRDEHSRHANRQRDDDGTACLSMRWLAVTFGS
jgi:hypothetical protein